MRNIFATSNKTGLITWGITQDHLLNDGKVSAELKAKIKATCKFHFKLYDDDGELYYSGYSNDDSSFKPLDWAMLDSGCTDIKYRNPITGIYESL